MKHIAQLLLGKTIVVPKGRPTRKRILEDCLLTESQKKKKEYDAARYQERRAQVRERQSQYYLEHKPEFVARAKRLQKNYTEQRRLSQRLRRARERAQTAAAQGGVSNAALGLAATD